MKKYKTVGNAALLPSEEEFASWGIRELSFKELLKVNGGSNVEEDSFDDEYYDDFSDTGTSDESGSDGVSHIVEEGDTLSDIVREYYPDASVDEIYDKVQEAAENSGIENPDLIYPGQEIILEPSSPSYPGVPNEGETESPTVGAWNPSPPSSGGSLWDDSWEDYDSDSDSVPEGGWNFGSGSGYTPSAPNAPAQQAESWHETDTSQPAAYLAQTPDAAQASEPEVKKGWGEKISDWFREKKEEAVGSIKERFNSAKDGAGERGKGLLGRGKRDYSKTEARYGSFPNASQQETTAWGWQHSLSKNTKKHVNELHPDIRTATKNMMVNLHNKGVNVEIVSSMRSIAEQDKLYTIGRCGKEDNRKIVTHAKGGESFHNFGLAFDVEVYESNGKKNWDVSSADWQSVIAEGQAQGFEAGATWEEFKDYPHFENGLGLSTKQLLERINNKQSEGGFVYVK